ncbi:hypothetical protein [Pseudomonas sp. TCU-HL1]|uniref:hypothetical protein n=1 Tax=Pseudomonas sp. TCU-HL1 TaxID=1856685 RepID=UPI00083E57B6|nr:hypothetical protein [Pseudomonas sp. TCU-HL1]AOE83559.1 4-hydroxy-3-methylbut-2-enyl diphosphatereductase [Pseudomonas sp. TCU-HL1]
MGIHDWARTALEQNLDEAKRGGIGEELALRALLSAVVERSAGLRSADDLAQELLFLADNLDSGRDYSFMRP